MIEKALMGGRPMRGARKRVDLTGRREKEIKKDGIKNDTSRRRKVLKSAPSERARKDLLDAYFILDHFTVFIDFSGLFAHSISRNFPLFPSGKNFKRDSNYL